MKFEIEKEALDRVVNYLITKPYAEVAQLLAGLSGSVKPIEEKEEAVNELILKKPQEENVIQMPIKGKK